MEADGLRTSQSSVYVRIDTSQSDVSIIVMDMEKFISLVQSHKCLWDQNDPQYHMRANQRVSWSEISEELKVPDEVLKRKWRGLRDTFVRELRKASVKKCQTSDTEPESKWPYFKLLLFLKDNKYTRNRKATKREIDESLDSDQELNGSAEFEDQPSPSASFPSQDLEKNFERSTEKKTTKSSLRRLLKRQRRDEIEAKLLQEEKKYFFQNANDPDYQYLMSLLPFLKDVPMHNKLKVRQKLIQVFIDEQDEMSF